MKKLLNDPAKFVDETIEGLLLAHPEQLKALSPDRRVLVRADGPQTGKVGIVTGGGSGHLPAFLGYVGDGLCTAVAIGNVFSSPSAAQMHAAIEGADSGAGVLLLYGNYGGDVFNFDLAADLAEANSIKTQTVLITDDILSAPAERASDRRGVAGMFFAFKLAGAAAERGDSLAEVTRLAQHAVNSTRTAGVGLSPTILPEAGKPTFDIGEDEMEIGIGIHGEPGFRRGKLETADEIAKQLAEMALSEFSIKAGDEVAVMVNGLGATPVEELYVLYRTVHAVLESRGVHVYRCYVGEYATSLEMAGASVSLLKLDDELVPLLDAPAHSPFFRQ